MTKKKKIGIVVFILAFGVMIVSLCYYKIQKTDETMQESVIEEIPETKTFRYDGVDYYPKQNQQVLLYMGINQTGEFHSDDKQENVQPESMMLIAVNEDAQTYSILQLNRNTQADIILSNQKKDTPEQAPIAQAYTYGKDVKDQCQNLEATISNYLTGIEIDNYLLFGIEALKMSNDQTGGSNVTIEDDFSQIDPLLIQGEKTTLLGDHALAYLQTIPGEDSIEREGTLRRQRIFFQCFTENLNRMTEDDSTFPIRLFQNLGNYIQTDCSTDQLASVLGNLVDYTLEQSVVLTGEEMEQDGKQVYVVDDDDMKKLCIELFYERK